jgi:hypothetical protein
MQAKSADTDDLWEDVPANVTFKPRLEFLLGNSIQGSRQTPQCMVAMHYTAF